MLKTKLIPFAILLGCASFLFAQTQTNNPKEKQQAKKEAKKPERGSLEEMFEKALKNNAEIFAAEAKVREAEARVREAQTDRMVVQQTVFGKIASMKAQVDAAKKTLVHIQELLKVEEDAHAAGAGQLSQLKAAKANVAKYEAEFLKAEADLKAMLGEFKPTSLQSKLEGDTTRAIAFLDEIYTLAAADGHHLRLWDVKTGKAHLSIETCTACHMPPHPNHPFVTSSPVTASMGDRIRKMLDTFVAIQGPSENVPVKETIAYLQKEVSTDVPFRILLGKKEDDKTTLIKGELPLHAWLQMVEDDIPDLRFIVREYGILVTTKDRVPQGSMTIQDFRLRKEVQLKSEETKKESPKTPKQ
jgi:ribosomal protein S9